MNRWHYFLQRMVLLGVSFLGIMLVCFFFTQVVPGGPVEQYIANLRQASIESGAPQDTLSAAQRAAVERVFGLDKPLLQRFWSWLWDDHFGLLAQSYKYTDKSAWALISERLPISLSFGVPSFLLTYLICIPLGIVKALRHGGAFDLATSMLVFVLYALPAFALGMLLRLWFAGSSEQFFAIFPLGGHRSEHFDQLSLGAQIYDQFMHMVLPVTCYIMGNFAVMTLLMKNALLEQISQDYVRTVLAKGAGLRWAVWRHALRNALIPIATGIGGILSVMFAGSVLIERVFDIHGIGQLSLDAIVGRDYPVFLAIVSLTSLLGLAGRVLSDFCYVLIDPRIHFAAAR